MMEPYQRIGEFLTFLCDKYQVCICIKDYVGFVPIIKSLHRVLLPYLIHSNEFCMFIKRDHGTYMKCLSMIPPMYVKCAQQDDHFMGYCHAGVLECVVPIKLDGKVLGSINTSFRGNPDFSKRLLKRFVDSTQPDMFAHAQALHERCFHGDASKAAELIPSLQLLAEYLSKTYTLFLSASVGDASDQGVRPYTNKDVVVAQVLEYIRQNYASRISVQQVAQFCHYSESFINHNFQKITGVNISTYVNKVRIEHAKNLLLYTNLSIFSIAYNVGYSDPNYFSKVFFAIVGITATEYRRRYRS